MKVVTFMNEKGGVGKTTMSTHIAAVMAATGYRVMLIDAAPQGHATYSFGLKKEAGLYDWLVREKDLEEVVRTPPRLDAIAIPGQQFAGQLFILPSNSETIGIPAQVDSYALMHGIEEMEDAIDLVIVDTDPATSALASLIYMASDAVVIPTQADSLSIDGLLSTIQRIGAYPHKDIQVMGIITNFYDHRTLLHRKNYSDLVKVGTKRNWSVWPPIKMRTAFREASNLRQMVYTLETDSATAAAKDVLAVAAKFKEALAYA